MSKRIVPFLLLLILVASSLKPMRAVDAIASTADLDQASSSVMFIENAGQWDDGARFQVWGGPAGTMWLAEDAIWFTVFEPGQEETGGVGSIPEGQPDTDPRLLPDNRVNPAPRSGVNIKLSFVGANPYPRIETFDRLDTKVSYFLGDDPEQWRPNVPVWGGVRYVDLYPGVDFEIRDEGGQMAQRLVARPDADLNVVRLHVEGAAVTGIDSGELRLTDESGSLWLPLPRASFSFRVEGETETGQAASWSVAPDFSATLRSLKPADNPADLLFGTFLGDSATDAGYAIAVDGEGSAHVTGSTWSTNFPTTPGAFDTSYNGSNDAFVVKLNAAGGWLAYATFLGGTDDDGGIAIAVDGAGSAYVTGYTVSTNFPTTLGAFDTSYNGDVDAVVAKLNPVGSGLTYATFLGGYNDDQSSGIAVDGLGSAYVTGATRSYDFPTTPGTFATSYNGGIWDAVVAKLNPAGSALAYATFLVQIGLNEPTY